MSITRHYCQKKSAGDFKVETRHFLTTAPKPCASSPKPLRTILSQPIARGLRRGGASGRGLRRLEGLDAAPLDTNGIQCTLFGVALTFIETPHFTRQIAEWVGDGEYRAFQQQLLEDPERGDLLVGCRGLRKVRMALGGRGKSGGARVIYLYLPEDHVLYLFLLFKKSDHANLSKSQRNQLGDLADQIKSEYARKRQDS